MRVCVQVTYVGVLVEKVQSVLIDSQDARGLEGGGARTLDVEEGGAKHGEGTDEAWRNTNVIWRVRGESERDREEEREREREREREIERNRDRERERERVRQRYGAT